MTDDIVNNSPSSQRYFGKYRGFVVDRVDPLKTGRLKLRIPSLLGGEETGWALPCLPFGGLANQGLTLIPEIDAQVWVEFEEGQLSYPIWTGTFWQQEGEMPTSELSDEPTRRIIRTPSGHSLEFEDADDEHEFLLTHPSGATIRIDNEGTIDITDANSSKITLDAEDGKIVIEDANGNRAEMSSSGIDIQDSNGNEVEMAASGITIKAQQIVVDGTQVMLGGTGGEPIIKGQSFLTMFATHIHPTGVGPSGPAIPQGEMTTLSTKVMST